MAEDSLGEAAGSLVDPPTTKVQHQIAAMARSYAEDTPKKYQKELQKMEDNLWENATQAREEGQYDDLAKWIQYPGTTSGRLSLYDREVAYYWATKHMAVSLMNERDANHSKF